MEKVNTEIVPNTTHVSKFHHKQQSNGPEKNLLPGRPVRSHAVCLVMTIILTKQYFNPTTNNNVMTRKQMQYGGERSNYVLPEFFSGIIIQFSSSWRYLFSHVFCNWLTVFMLVGLHTWKNIGILIRSMLYINVLSITDVILLLSFNFIVRQGCVIGLRKDKAATIRNKIGNN